MAFFITKKNIAFICIFILILVALITIFLVINKYSEIENFDSYTNVWSSQLFVDKKLTVSDSGIWPVITFANHLSLQILTNYHNLDLKNIYKKWAEMHIMIDGEPTDIANPEDYDIIITTKKNMKNTVFLPYYIFHCVEARLNINNINNQYNNYSDRKFAVFAYSNCDEKFSGVKRRREFYEKLKNRFGNKIHNLGRCYNNKKINQPGAHVRNNNEFSEFKFVIAFENKAIEGYVSEKLINPIFAGCIPVYCGAPDVAKYINPKRFINVNDFSSDEEVFNRMLEISNNPNLFNKIVSEPALVEAPSIYNYYSFLLGKGKTFIDIYNQAPPSLRDMMPLNRCVLNRIVFCTFADGKKYKNKRIENEAEKSEYFDDVITYSSLDLKPSWNCETVGRINFDINFIRNPKASRGYGYWTWKPYIILKALCENCKDGDVLVYSDSGSSIQPFMTTKMMEYVKSVEGNTPILGFTMLYKEKFWSKGDLIDRIFQNTPTEEKNIALNSTPYQFTASTIILRKCQDVIEFIKEWHNIAQENNHMYIDDSPSLNNKDEQVVEHRHDQSIFSLLCKKNSHLVTKSMDAQIDNKLNETQQCVFKRRRNPN